MLRQPVANQDCWPLGISASSPTARRVSSAPALRHQPENQRRKAHHRACVRLRCPARRVAGDRPERRMALDGVGHLLLKRSRSCELSGLRNRPHAVPTTRQRPAHRTGAGTRRRLSTSVQIFCSHVTLACELKSEHPAPVIIPCRISPADHGVKARYLSQSITHCRQGRAVLRHSR